MENENTENPMELIGRFSRCVNFPRDLAGMHFLAQGLAKASRDTGIAMEWVVSRCAELSEYCPTDCDLLKVAKELKIRLQDEQEASRKEDQERRWQNEYGQPAPFASNWDHKRAGEIIDARRRMMISI